MDDDRELNLADHPALLREIQINPNMLVERYSNLTTLKCSSLYLTRLPNLPVTLRVLICDNNELTVLPDLPATLRGCKCSNNQLTELPDLPATLQILICDNNELTELPNLPATLQTLMCNSNQLPQLPNLPATLQIFICDNNRLTELPNLPVTLKTLSCNINQLTELPPLPTGLTYMGCEYNQIRQLPPLPLGASVAFNNNPLETPPVYVDGTPYVPNDDDDDDDDDEINADELAGQTTQTTELYNSTQPTPPLLNSSNIPQTAEGFDFINQEHATIQNYLAEDPRNMVFATSANNYILVNKDAISDNLLTPYTIKFACNSLNSLRRENIQLTTPYMIGRALGMSGGLIPLSTLKAVLTDDSIRAVFVVATGINILTTVSYQMLLPGANMIGASHCQEGQGDTVYSLEIANINSATATGGKRGRRTRHRRKLRRRQVRTYRRRPRGRACKKRTYKRRKF